MKILAPAPNTLTPPTVWPSLEQMQNWAQAVACQQALDANAVLVTKYTTETFGDWLASYSIGRLPYNSTPPAPPAGNMVVVQDDGITCDLTQIGPPVCAVPSYVPNPPPQTQEQAAQMLATLGANPFTKSAPLLTRLTAADGSAWVRVA